MPHGLDSASNRNEYEESSLVVMGSRSVRLDVSQLYGPSRPLTGIALSFYLSHRLRMLIHLEEAPEVTIVIQIIHKNETWRINTFADVDIFVLEKTLELVSWAWGHRSTRHPTFANIAASIAGGIVAILGVKFIFNTSLCLRQSCGWTIMYEYDENCSCRKRLP
jgi:hypothetical protein